MVGTKVVDLSGLSGVIIKAKFAPLVRVAFGADGKSDWRDLQANQLTITPQQPNSTNQVTGFEGYLKQVIHYAKQNLDEPDKDGYVVSPDSVSRKFVKVIEENTNKIVKAVNMHDELLNGYKEIIKIFRNKEILYGATDTEWEMFHKAEQLLKQAEQK